MSAWRASILLRAVCRSTSKSWTAISNSVMVHVLMLICWDFLLFSICSSRIVWLSRTVLVGHLFGGDGVGGVDPVTGCSLSWSTGLDSNWTPILYM